MNNNSTCPLRKGCMNLHQLDLNLLLALDLLLTEQSVTLAAEKAGITQPAMSNTLRRLREHFQDPLLVKSSQGKMILTDQALRIAPLVKPALYHVEQVFSFKNEFVPFTSTQHFKILTNDYIECLVFPNLLNRFAVQAPQVVLDILSFNKIESDKINAINQLESGGVDLAIGKFEELPASFHKQVLFEDRLVCIARQGHPALQNGLDLETFLQLKHLLISIQGIGLGAIDVELAKQKLKRQIAYYTRHFLLAPKLIGQSDLIACIPQRIADLFADTEQLQLHPPPLPSEVTFTVSQIWGAFKHKDPALQWLRNEITLLFHNRL